MAQSLAEWLEQHADRQSASARAGTDVAKLLATFVAGIAATLVASTLQVGATNSLDKWASSLLGVTILATILVIAIDRLQVPDEAKILTESAIYGRSDQVTL